MTTSSNDKILLRAMKLSLAVGIGMLVMKMYAWLITGSSAIFSDAAESIVHNVAVAFALYSVWYSSRPADRTHPYGHDKIGYFSAGFEGSMIILAGGVIIYDAIHKWIHGLSLQNLSTGTWFTVAAFLINAALGAYLLWRGKKHNSIILEANGKHVLTDSWTSLGVIIGLVLVQITGWLPFDPLCAIFVALNIFWSGFELIRRSFRGLMDQADPDIDQRLREILEEETKNRGVLFHQLKHRVAGKVLFVELHLLFPDETHVRAAHQQATEIEQAIRDKMKLDVSVITHLEPVKDHQRIHKGEPISEPSAH